MKRIYFLALFIFCAFTAVDAQKFVVASFEDGSTPAGWTADALFEVGPSSLVGSAFFSPPDHSSYVIYNDDGPGGTAPAVDINMTTDAIDMSAVTSAQLVFSLYYFDALYGGAQESANFEISTVGTTWTEIIDLPGNTEEWQSIQFDLADYVGNSAVSIRVNYNDGGGGWLYGVAIDDFFVINPLTNDVLASGFSTDRYVKGGTNSDIGVNITNYGSDNLTSVDIAWSNGTDTYMQTVTGLNLATFESTLVTHETGFTSTEATEYELTMTVTAPNGGVDEDMNDNAVPSSFISVITDENIEKNMVAEEATGTWCTWCPRGAVFMDQMAEDFPETFVGVAVHNGQNDPMVLAEHDAGLRSISGFPGFPSVGIDRISFVDPSDLPDLIQANTERATPVAIDASASFTTDEDKIVLEMTTEFFTDVSDRRFNVSAIVIENGVTGTGSGYDQVNAYAGGGQGDMGGFEDLPNPVPAAQMVYNHVSRALIGGWNGMAGDITATVANGDAFTQTMTIDIDPTWDPNELILAVIVIDTESGIVVNGQNVEIEGMFTPTNNVELADFNLYPNPAQSTTELTFSLEKKQDVNVMIYNNLGQVVWTKAYGEMVGNQNFNLDVAGLNTGAYTLVVQLEANEFVAKQLHIVK